MKALFVITLAVLALAGCAKDNDSSKPQAGQGIIGENKARISTVALGEWNTGCSAGNQNSSQIDFTLEADGKIDFSVVVYQDQSCSTGAQPLAMTGKYTLQLNDDLQGKMYVEIPETVDHPGISDSMQITIQDETMTLVTLSEEFTHNGKKESNTQLNHEAQTYHKVQNAKLNDSQAQQSVTQQPAPQQPNVTQQTQPAQQSPSITVPQPSSSQSSSQQPIGSSQSTTKSANNQNLLLGDWASTCDRDDQGGFSLKGVMTLNSDGSLQIKFQGFQSTDCSGAVVQTQLIKGRYLPQISNNVGTIVVETFETDEVPHSKLTGKIEVTEEKLTIHPTVFSADKNGKTLPADPRQVDQQVWTRVH